MRFGHATRNGGGRRRIWSPLVLPVLALAAFSAACERDDAPPIAEQRLPEGVEMAQTAMRTVITREGIRRATVEGDTAEWYGEHEVHLRPMRIWFYDASGNTSSEVTSVYGIYNELSGDLEAEGDVVAEDHVDGQRIETERMRYVNADGRLHGPVPFRLSRAVGSMFIEGSAFESDPGLDSIIVFNPEGETRPRLITSADTAATADPVDADAAEGAVAGDDADAAEGAVAEAPDGGVPDAEVIEDTAVALPDAATAEDTAVALPDAEVTEDTAIALPDTATAPPDTAVPPPDSTTAPPDTTASR